MAKEDMFLTETILAIQHEVQSALDYVDVVSRQEATELGMGSAIMALEKMRIKLPFAYSLEQEIHYIEEEKPPPTEPSAIKEQLAARKGFPIDIGRPGGKARFVKLRFIPPHEVSAVEAPSEEQAPQILIGELELSFIPLSRR